MATTEIEYRGCSVSIITAEAFDGHDGAEIVGYDALISYPTGKRGVMNRRPSLAAATDACKTKIDHVYGLGILDKPAPKASVHPRCAICGEPAEMSASRGPACPDHYDELS